MATKVDRTFICNVNFYGDLLKVLECRLLIDLIKFIIYEKQQMTMSYDELMAIDTNSKV